MAMLYDRTDQYIKIRNDRPESLAAVKEMKSYLEDFSEGTLFEALQWADINLSVDGNQYQLLRFRDQEDSLPLSLSYPDILSALGDSKTIEFRIRYQSFASLPGYGWHLFQRLFDKKDADYFTYYCFSQDLDYNDYFLYVLNKDQGTSEKGLVIPQWSDQSVFHSKSWKLEGLKLNFDFYELSPDLLMTMPTDIPPVLLSICAGDYNLDGTSLSMSTSDESTKTFTGEELIRFKQEVTPWIELLRARSKSISGTVKGFFRSTDSPWEALVLYIQFDDNPDVPYEDHLQQTDPEKYQEYLLKKTIGISKEPSAVKKVIQAREKVVLPQQIDRIQFGLLTPSGQKEEEPDFRV